MLLPEKIEFDSDGIMKQKALISDEIRNGTKLSALAAEHMSQMQCNKSDGDYSKSEYDWINPKKSMSITYFFKKCKNEEEKVKVNNEHSMLIDEYDNDEEEEEDDEMKYYTIKKMVQSVLLREMMTTMK